MQTSGAMLYWIQRRIEKALQSAGQDVFSSAPTCTTITFGDVVKEKFCGMIKQKAVPG